MSRLRSELVPLVDTVYQSALEQVSAAEQELRATLRQALHRINFADRQLDALRKRIETIYGHYADRPDPRDPEADYLPNPLDELWDQIDNDGLGIYDLEELRGLAGETMKALKAVGRALAKQHKTLHEIAADISD